MKFYDQVVVTVQSGKGGDGVVSARREAGVPYGGPAGGNGGKGGSVIFYANEQINTLIDFHFQKKRVAANGEPGRTKEQYGKQADDLFIGLPLGSIVRDAHTHKPLFRCDTPDARYVICTGGQGGIGNMHFKNAVNQYPQFSLLGEPGETREVEIELQLLADVALIGTPSVGKSSLINAIANVKAKVADYPFTTLIPNIGSVKHHDISFNVVDVPGLIEGASQGKGLGNEFLRHIMKARVLCFMMDMGRYEEGMKDFSMLASELVQYLESSLAQTKDYGDIKDIHCFRDISSPQWKLIVSAMTPEGEKNIISKDICLVANKSDILADQDIIAEYQQALFDHISVYFAHAPQKNPCPLSHAVFHPLILSTYTRDGITEWLNTIVDTYILPYRLLGQQAQTPSDEPVSVAPRSSSRVSSLRIKETTQEDMPILIAEGFVDEQDTTYAKVWHVTEREVCRLVYMIPWGNDEAEMRFRNVLDKKRLLQKIITAGLVKGDIIHVHSFYAGVEDRFIRY